MNKAMWSKARVALVAASAAWLAACGGGGNESGPPDQIMPSTTSVHVTGPAGGCATGTGPTVYLFGGQPPYRLSNGYPSGMQLDKTQVDQSGQGFTITFIGGACMSTVPITIEDTMGRLATVQVTNALGT
ncbi:hypothetical protein [Ideonella sp.]|uniref:hypothetical protein n=1 Tax=Ideonella sp. TaxID=1929293 RepID=UPI002B48A652|nr:hypothetical protein [Ideonella sp.]